MDVQQEKFVSAINNSSADDILINKTGWKEMNFPWHSHGKHQIIYTISGTLYIQIGTTQYFVPEKHIAWIPPGVSHCLYSNNAQVSLVNFYIAFDSGYINVRERGFAVYGVNLHIAENLKYIASGHVCINKKEEPDLYLFAQGFLNLLPSMSPCDEILLKTLVIPDDIRLYPVLDYIKRHISENVRIEQVANSCGLSVRNLSRLLRASGMHFSNYLNQQRILRSIELLVEGEKTIKQIAFEVGFTSPTNFNRSFRRITGKTPGTFVKKNKDINAPQSLFFPESHEKEQTQC